jgi:LysM repeat protein
MAVSVGWPSLAMAAGTNGAKADGAGAAASARGTEAAGRPRPAKAGAEVEDVDEDESAEDAGPLPVTAGDRPTRAPAHADCGFRMPLYEHTVEKGEHLGMIAGRYGVRHAEVVALNPQLTNPDLIRPGDKIRVCPEIFPRLIQRVEHAVKPGETLGGIAQAYGLSLRTLLEQQDGSIGDPNLVRVGQRLVLWIDGGLAPDFLPPEPKAAARATKASGGGPRASVATVLPHSEHLLIKRPRAAYGTAKTIELVQRAVSQYGRAHPSGPKVVVGDISRKGGGQLAPHASHQTGRDIDLGYVVRSGPAKRVGGKSYANLDVARTWALIEAFLDTKQVVYVFVDYRLQEQLYEHAKAQGVPQRELDGLFQYPHGRGRAHGIIRHWPNHRHHFHVRFRS